MSNLIEREKAIRAVAADLMANAILKSADASDNIRDWIPMAEDILSIVPTVDAVPVVRCRNCRFSQRINEWVYECYVWNDDRMFNQYCDMGEQKDGDGNEG